MALEHALLVALSERPAAGLDLARRFEPLDRVLLVATHQQIYRVLGRMEADGWVTVTEVPQAGKPRQEGVRRVPGRAAGPGRLARRADRAQPLRSELAVKLRGASFADDREAVLDVVRANLADHARPAGALRRSAKRDYPEPGPSPGSSSTSTSSCAAASASRSSGWTGSTEYLEAHA